MRMRPVKLMRVVLASALMLAIATAPASAESPVTVMADQVGIVQKLEDQLPLDLTFHDESGRTVRLGEYFKDKPVILTLAYFRCPMLCTQVLNGLLKSSQAMKLQMGHDYEVITVSFDPSDTPRMAAEKKARYVSSYRRDGAERGWHFLTGDKDAIDRLARSVGFRYRYDPKSDQFAHGSGLMVLTPTGKLSRYLYGIDFSPTDLRLGLVESGMGRIGSPVDAILLLCYHYDPASGKYGLVIANVLRLAGSLTVFALGSFLIVMFRKERRRSQQVRAAALAGQRTILEPHG